MADKVLAFLHMPLDPKIKDTLAFMKFRTALKCRPVEAMGYLAELKCFVGRNPTVDGSLGDMTPELLATEVCDWCGDTDVFINALIVSGWLRYENGVCYYGPWETECAPILVAREKNRIKNGTWRTRKKKKKPDDSSVTGHKPGSDRLEVEVEVEDIRRNKRERENARAEILESSVAVIGSDADARTVNLGQLETILENEFGWHMQSFAEARKLAPFSRNEIDDCHAETLAKADTPNFTYFLSVLKGLRRRAERETHTDTPIMAQKRATRAPAAPRMSFKDADMMRCMEFNQQLRECESV